MQIVAASTTMGVPVMTVDGVDRAGAIEAPMRVFTRELLGRHTGYGSLTTALSAARNLSRGDDRAAVVVQRAATGVYEVRDAVWRYAGPIGDHASARVPYRHFHFEDGSFSSYTATVDGRRVQVAARDTMRAFDGVTRWLVDGSRVVEVTDTGAAT